MALLVVLAVVLKSVIPAGFMPVVGKDGFTQIVICSGIGQKTISVPSNDAPETDHKEDQAGKVCAWQILASGKTILSPPLAAIPAPILTRIVIKAADNAPVAAVYNLPFEARGPPLS